MPETITGLDIGRDSLKAVSLSTGLKGYQIHDAVVVRIAEAGGLEEALKEVFQREAFRQSSCVTALPLDRCSLRDVRLPFRDRKRISQTLPYELEQSLPYPVDGALVDYLVIDRSDETELLAVAVRERDLAERLEMLSTRVASCPVVDVEATALADWLLAETGEEAGAVLIDAGAARTALAVIDQGRIIHLRSLPLGGNRVIAAVASDRGVEPDEAERMVRSGESLCDHAWKHLCAGIYREVSSTLDLLRLRGLLKQKPARLYLVGGCSLSSCFREEMGRLFSLDPRVPAPPQEQSLQFTEGAKERWNGPLMSQALALALREAGKGRGFNFVRRQGSARGIVEKIREELPWLGPFAAALILLAGVNLFLDHRSNSRYLSLLQGEARAMFMETLPGTTRIVDPVQQMRTAVEGARRVSTGRDRGTPLTVLSILRDMSTLVPDSVEFLITNFTYDEQQVRIQGETDNFNTVDAIRSSLERGDAFQSVTITSANMMRQGGRVSFDLRMEPRR